VADDQAEKQLFGAYLHVYFYNHITISIKYSEKNIIYVTTWANPIKTGSDVY
jgi:hypothetical protein